MCPLRQPCRSGSLSWAGSPSVSSDGRSIKTLVFFTIKLIYLAREKKITCKKKIDWWKTPEHSVPLFQSQALPKIMAGACDLQPKIPPQFSVLGKAEVKQPVRLVLLY